MNNEEIKNKIIEDTFDQIIDSIVPIRILQHFNDAEIENISMVQSKDCIYFLDSNNKKIDYYYMHHDNNIDFRIVQSSAKMFIEKYRAIDITNAFKLKMQQKEEHEQLMKANKYRLDKLLIKIKETGILKYNDNNADLKIEEICSSFIYELVIDIRYDYYKVNLSDNGSSFSVYWGNKDKRENYTEEELLNLIKDNIPKYEEKYQADLKVQAEKKAAEEKEYKFQEILWNIYKSGALIKGKRSFTVYKNGIKYSVGNGKSGKYIKCNYQALEKILRNSIGYIDILPDVYKMSTEELKMIKYKNIN